MADVGVDDAAGLLLALSCAAPRSPGCHLRLSQGCGGYRAQCGAIARRRQPKLRASLPWSAVSTGKHRLDAWRYRAARSDGRNLPDDDASCSPAETGGVSAAEFIAKTARSAPGKVVLASSRR